MPTLRAFAQRHELRLRYGRGSEQVLCSTFQVKHSWMMRFFDVTASGDVLQKSVSRQTRDAIGIARRSARPTLHIVPVTVQHSQGSKEQLRAQNASELGRLQRQASSPTARFAGGRRALQISVERPAALLEAALLAQLEGRVGHVVLRALGRAPNWGSAGTKCARSRVLRIDVVGQGFQLVHFNIHNHGLNTMQIDEICAEIDAARVRAAADPLHFLVIVQGDLNFGPDEALLLRSEQPVPRHVFESPLFRQRIEGMFKDGAGAETLCSAAVYQEHFKDMLKEDVHVQYGVKIFLSPVGWWRPRLPQLA
ncbi:unnamed protein product [Prorocentrum cordatum]|uniref:Endonuclease/exonuclease/phosphatase domain-containing protein n=1 Tax=Prorocentrum cordatum TaxID=2364126 RepID=A0ABN9TNX8_9DINO|nr:unnamed protein product [Polarella glacialis]